MELAEVSGKIQHFSGKNPTFHEKIVSYPPKFLMTFFSHQLQFSNFTIFSQGDRNEDKRPLKRDHEGYTELNQNA